jgi:hypothetical protein
MTRVGEPCWGACGSSPTRPRPGQPRLPPGAHTTTSLLGGRQRLHHNLVITTAPGAHHALNTAFGQQHPGSDGDVVFQQLKYRACSPAVRETIRCFLALANLDVWALVANRH